MFFTRTEINIGLSFTRTGILSLYTLLSKICVVSLKRRREFIQL